MDKTVRDVLAEKGSNVLTVDPAWRVANTVAMMVENKVGSVVVVRDGGVRGIFTERDVLTRVVVARRDATSVDVAEVMTANPITIHPAWTVERTMKLMTDKRVRHLPVLEQEALVGLVSIGDLTRWVTRHLKNDLDDLQGYITGQYPVPE